MKNTKGEKIGSPTSAYSLRHMSIKGVSVAPGDRFEESPSVIARLLGNGKCSVTSPGKPAKVKISK